MRYFLEFLRSLAIPIRLGIIISLSVLLFPVALVALVVALSIWLLAYCVADRPEDEAQENDEEMFPPLDDTCLSEVDGGDHKT